MTAADTRDASSSILGTAVEEPTFAGDLTAFRARLAARGIDVDTLQTETSGTLQTPSAEVPLDLSTLPVLSTAQGDLSLGAKIGDGGMGVVHVARQRALERDVAVKIVRAGRARERDEAMIDLVREARVAGALEHPNIVPVHALARSETGEVLLIMKRIEGRAWSSLLAERGGIDRDLRVHLDVLMDVCRAVHFAHARGVVHCDLKPQNVMVGGFGEVYLLDWGIAVPSGTITRCIFGTPSFIAPEMVTLDAVLDARTDVYLLGGLLHVILTGRPPHAFGSISESLHAAACAAPPRFIDRVPEELARICLRALSAQKQNRFQSADEFRLALVGYLEHAGARALCEGATEQLADLEAMLSPTDSTAADADLDARAFRAWTAARFGFEQALREWPAFGAARSGLERAHVAFVRWELRRRRADRARAILAEVSLQHDGLTQELAALEAADNAAAEERRRRDAIAHAFDLSGRSSSHVSFYIAAAAPWLITTFVAGHLWRRGLVTPTTTSMAVMMVLLSLAFAGITLWGRLRVDSVLFFRLSLLTTAALVGIVLTWTAAALTGAPFVSAYVTAQLFLGLITATMGVFVHPAMAVGVVPVLLSLPIMIAFPTWCFEANGVTLAIALALVARAWPRAALARPPTTP